MIRAKVGEETLAMTFTHAQLGEETLGDSPVRGATRCTLYREEPGEGKIPAYVELGLGEAWCAIQDNFCKETGRKVALGRALEAVFPGAEGKATRKALWGAYWGRK